MKRLWGISYGILLSAFTAYVLLDTFVLPKVYQTVPPDGGSAVAGEREGQDAGNPKSAPERYVSPAGEAAYVYTDDEISISITQCTENDTAVYVADVRLSSPEYLKTAFANAAYGKNVTARTSEIAAEERAILAINGDYYGVQEKGYVLRNGVLYRDTAAANREDLVIYNDGSFGIFAEESVTAESLLLDGAAQILSFGPALVTDGQISVTEQEEVGKAMASNPRTAIGFMGELHYVFVVSDGRTSQSEGLTLYELAEFMQGLGVLTAYNLDGGGSSTMYFNGEVINKPTTNGRKVSERSVSDIVYIGY